MTIKVNAARALKELRAAVKREGGSHVAPECVIARDNVPVCIVGHVLDAVVGRENFKFFREGLEPLQPRGLVSDVAEGLGVELTPAAAMVLAFAQTVQDGRGAYVNGLGVKQEWGTTVQLTSDFCNMYIMGAGVPDE